MNKEEKKYQEMMDTMDKVLQQNDKLAATQLCTLLVKPWLDTQVLAMYVQS